MLDREGYSHVVLISVMLVAKAFLFLSDKRLSLWLVLFVISNSM